MGVCTTKPCIQLYSWTGEQPDLVTAQGTGAVMLDLQDKAGTNSNLILLSTAGLGALSVALCRKNFWEKQIGFFFFRRAPYCMLVGCEPFLVSHMLKGFQGCLPV